MNTTRNIIRNKSCRYLLNLNQSRTIYEKYRHGPTKISNPDPDYKQWVKDFFGPEGKEFIRSEAKRIAKKPFRAPFKVFKANETYIFEHFDSDKSVERWKPVADSDSLNGFSKSTVVRSRFGHALFKGYLDSRIPDDGFTMNSGFVALIGPQAERDNAFDKQSFYNWTSYNCFEIKYRGDGRRYHIVVNTSTYDNDTEYYNAYSYPLYTRGGPYWQTARIPFPKFIFTNKGWIQDRQGGLPPHRIKFVAIALEDKIDGPFSLEIDYMGLRLETTPFEEDCAYEQYAYTHMKYKPIHLDCAAPE